MFGEKKDEEKGRGRREGKRKKRKRNRKKTKRKRKDVLIKSNNPHLAGGESVKLKQMLLTCKSVFFCILTCFSKHSKFMCQKH